MGDYCNSNTVVRGPEPVNHIGFHRCCYYAGAPCNWLCGESPARDGFVVKCTKHTRALAR